MTVEALVPQLAEADPAEVLATLRAAPRSEAAPFHPRRIAFSDALSRAIFGHPDARAFPELTAVAFWLRRAAVGRLAERFRLLESSGAVRVPRGLAFHVPPTNVDTLFVYSLMVSFLVGNLNVVRVSRDRSTQQIALLCETLREVLRNEEFHPFASELAVVAYGHEPEPTATFSREADVRLLWGGDDAISRVRAAPIGPATQDLTFGDRFSFAALRAREVLDASPEERRDLAWRLFNDTYWFDQLGCASPRLVVWVGEQGEIEPARDVVFDGLARVIAERDYEVQPGAAIAKMTFTYGALIDRPVEYVRRAGNELTVLGVSQLEGFDRTHPGAGLLFETSVAALSDLLPFLERKDQTLVTYGFAADELETFARSAHGRGIDRIVPVGEALTFGSLWDGYDLLAELTRTVHVAAAP
jgi:hypothetical protein